MPAAFVFATFGIASVISFLLDHVLALSGVGLGVGIIVCVVLAIFVPGSVTLIRTALGVLMKGLQWLITTTAGAFILVAIGCFLAGFWTHTFLDKSIELQKQVEAQRAATAAAQAAAFAAQLQAAALRDLNAAASKRAEAAETQSEDLQEQVTDYAAQLVAADKNAKTPPRSYALTAADVAALRGIGAPPKPR
jgi:uncharacterized membrane protein YgaE (UPF0421/DUF939 family)